MRLARWIGRPLLSVVVVVYRMPAQAERTLRSLSSDYQRGVDARDYEIIVVENDSDRLLGPHRARAAAADARYFHRVESTSSPVGAVNFGVGQARGRHVAVMVDGARMLSPGVVRLSLDALRMDPSGVVALTGYHLGHRAQQEAIDAGEYGEVEESALLARIAWPQDGYRLFEVAALSASAREGFLLPSPESTYLAMSRHTWRALGGMDTRYDIHGGGYVNHDLYKRALERPGARCYFLFGEGSFHQFHGGVTTGTPAAERDLICREIIDQDARLRPGDRSPPENPPVFFGTLEPSAYRFLRHSVDRAIDIRDPGHCHNPK